MRSNNNTGWGVSPFLLGGSMKSYASLHTHSTFSLGDSTTTPYQIIDKCKSLGITALAFTEHGNITSWIEKKKACDKAGIKYIHGIELYMTESLTEKVKDNYHVILLAKNWEGVMEINELSTIATDLDHMYYKPRISFDEFLGTSDNIIRLSACLGGVLANLDENHARYNELLNKFDYLEVQPHAPERQFNYNFKLRATGKPLVATGDFHSTDAYESECRSTLRRSKGMEYDDEDEYPVVMMSRDEMETAFTNQGLFFPPEIETILNNTLKIADMVEDFDLDETFKFPNLYENAKEKIGTDTYAALELMINSGRIIEELIDTYIERVQTELHAFSVLGMESFILFMGELNTWALTNGIMIGPARGSASGSLVCYLLNVTDVDPIEWGTNFTRFINVNRISLPDIDEDFAPEDRQKVFNYIRDRFGGEQSAHITTYGKLGVKKIIEAVSRANSIPIYEMAGIKTAYAEIEKEEGKLNKKHDNGGISDVEYELELEVIEKKMEDLLRSREDIFHYYEGMKGTVDSVGIHAAGMIGSPINIRRTIGLRYDKKKDNYVSSCAMKAIDGLNYVKYDILSLKTLQVIKHTYQLLGKKVPRSNEMDWCDEKVFESISDSPIGLFQFESDESWRNLTKFGCKSVRDIAFVTAVIRPSCASFREQAIGKIANKNPNKEIDELLTDSIGYLVYQEQQISFLQKLCGFTEGEADVVRRAIGKKDPVLLAEWLPKIEAGYIANSKESKEVAMVEVEQFMQVFISSANYSFSYNHAIAYSMITYMTAYLRHHHPIEFTTAYLNNATDDDDIQDGTKLAKVYGIKIENPKYGKSESRYTIKDGVIYKGIESVLYISDRCSQELAKLATTPMSFHQLVNASLGTPNVNTRQIEVLIKIDFFSEFGKAKKLFEWFQRHKIYNGKKQFKKGEIPIGTQKIIDYFLQKKDDEFSETAKMYKVDSYKILDEIFNRMKDIDYTKLERIVHQLSYLNYLQDEDLQQENVFTVVTNKTKNDSWLLKNSRGVQKWYKSSADLSKGDLILINVETEVTNGRHKNAFIVAFDKIILDRNTQKKI